MFPRLLARHGLTFEHVQGTHRIVYGMSVAVELAWTSEDRHTSRIRSIDIAPDLKHVVTGSNDGKVKLWSVDDRGRTVATADAPSGCWVTVAAFSPDSTRVLAAGDAGCT